MTSTRRQPIPVSDWPLWAKALASKRLASDAGIGDTAERVLRSVGGELFKSQYKLMFGHDCGCEMRRDFWNLLYPYAPLTVQ